jgi:hypothetical protein
MSLESDGGMILTGENQKLGEKTCTSATLSTTSPTWTDPGANLGLCGERSATNRLSHCTATVLTDREWQRSCHVPDKTTHGLSCVPVAHAIGLSPFKSVTKVQNRLTDVWFDLFWSDC